MFEIIMSPEQYEDVTKLVVLAHSSDGKDSYWLLSYFVIESIKNWSSFLKDSSSFSFSLTSPLKPWVIFRDTQILV